jgi:hypothetical protein
MMTLQGTAALLLLLRLSLLWRSTMVLEQSVSIIPVL